MRSFRLPKAGMALHPADESRGLSRSDFCHSTSRPMTNGFAMISCSDGKPPGPNCNGPYPWAIKGCREYSSGDVERPVHVGIHRAFVSRLIHPLADASPAKVWLLLASGIIGWNLVPIQERSFACVCLFPMCTSCFQRGCNPIIGVLMRCCTRTSIMRCEATCR
jgi:hypothetical protein